MGSDSKIAIIEFKKLLHNLRDLRPDLGIRVRLMGEMWQNRHSRVLQVTENGAALQDPQTRAIVIIRDLSHVMQFELEEPFQHYRPYHHYSVDPALVDH